MVEKSFYQLIGYDLTQNQSTREMLNNNYYRQGCNSSEVDEVVREFSKRPRNYKFSTELQQKIKKGFGSLFKEKVDPTMVFSKNLGNIYCGSLYTLLLGLIINKQTDLLVIIWIK